MRVAIIATIALVLVTAAGADDEKKVQPSPQSRINDENYKKVSRKGLSEAEVMSVLGNANRVTAPSEGIKGLVWEEVIRIRVVFKDGNVNDLQAEFSQHLQSKSLSEANFKKLKKGMAEAEVQRILGPNTRQAAPQDDTMVVTWERLNQIEVQFQDGKVSGYARVRSLED